MGKRAKYSPPDDISRREFFKRSVSLTAALGASSLILGAAAGFAPAAGSAPLGAIESAPNSSPNSSPSASSSVILARSSNRPGDQKAFYRLLVNSALRRLAGTERPEDAWAKFFSPGDVVAIKVNSITGRNLSTSPALATAIADGLISCGVRPNKILIWDRTSLELRNAGFEIRSSGKEPFCFGTDSDSIGYESSPTVIGSIGSCFSNIVTEYATALINVPILREHSAAGISVALKNNYGAIHNPNKYHADGCTPFVADVNAHPDLRKKTRLIICDAARVQFQSGPGYKPKWIADFGGILLSSDPVALDTIAAEEIDKLRKAARLRTLREERRYPGYLSVASDDSHSLGISERSRIDVVNAELS